MKMIKKIGIICFFSAYLLVNDAGAFGFLPPMPWDMEFDGVDNAAKVVSKIQDIESFVKGDLKRAGAAQLKLVAGGLNTSIMNKVTSAFLKKTAKEKEVKNPGQGGIQANSTLGIAAGEVNEENLRDAYYKSFFIYPSASDVGIDGIRDSVMQTALSHHIVNYQQDVIMTTYVTARFNEDYMSSVDETLNRFLNCQKQEGYSVENCTFFNLVMSEPNTNNELDDDAENNPGLFSATRNAYIATVLYDRVLRLVEDLTAIEAIYDAASELHIVTPQKDTESNASDYLQPSTLLAFSYREQKDYAHAEAIVTNYNFKTACPEGSTNASCPQFNTTQVELDNIEDTPVLEALRPIDNKISDAMAVHNLKNQLSVYKTQYRKYLKAKEQHDKALNMVKESDVCTLSFLDRHLSNGAQITAKELWYGTTFSPVRLEDYRNYESRGGISKELLQKHDEVAEEAVLAESTECKGYYETESSCPTGYTWDQSTSCTYEDDNGQEIVDKTLHPCIVKTTETDGSLSGIDENSDIAAEDYLQDATVADSIDDENRKNQETNWRIGADKMMVLATPQGDEADAILTFDQWNDQKTFYQTYLSEKYRNILLIVRSIDLGQLSYKLVTDSMTNNDTSGNFKKIENIVEGFTTCSSLSAAKEQAKSAYCSGYSSSLCEVSTSKGYVIVKKYRYQNGIKRLSSTTSFPQYISSSNASTCTFKKSSAGISGSGMSISENIVSTYFKLLGVTNAESFYIETKNKGRIIARDKLQAVIDERTVQEAKIENLIKAQKVKMENLRRVREELLKKQTEINNEIDKVQKLKNLAQKQYDLSEQHITDLDYKISDYDNRLAAFEQLAKEVKSKDVTTEKKVIAELKNKAGLERNFLAQCEDLSKSVYSTKIQNYETYLLSYDSEGNEQEISEVYVRPCAAKKQVEEQTSSLTELNEKLEIVKNDITDNETAVTEATEDFAEKYLEAEEAAQTAINNKNDDFESFLIANDGESRSSQRMKRKNKKYVSDNLATTVQRIFTDKDTLKKAIKATLGNNTLKVLSSDIDVSQLTDDYYLGKEFGEGNSIVAVLEDLVVEYIASQITSSDETVEKLLEKAENTVITRKGAVEISTFNEAYDKIKTKHKELVNYLQSLQNGYGNIFGIPGGISFDTADEDYFAALPARGINFASDGNAGRDYMTPKEPLLGLPPLREIFYFSALDYGDISKDKKGRPVIPELLVEKYSGESWNYLPDIWLNILARPNLREDKLYQNTFVEKSMNEEQLKAMLNKSNSDTEYKKMIWRSGVFPCRYSGKIVDVDGPSDISNTKKQSKRKRTLRQLSSSVSDAKFVCQEMLSSEKVGSSETYTGLYPEISELGNFLAMSGSRLIYRNELKNIYNYLTTENKKIDKSKNPETSMHRVAERATFIRNVFGGFLDAVEMENTTYNTLQNYEEDVNESLQSLCEQLQNVNVVEADEKCENWKLEEKILATAVEDDKYDVDCKNTQTLSSGGYIYNTIFCILDNKKAELLSQIENGWSDDGGANKGYNTLKDKINDSRYTERLTEIKNAINILKEDSSEWCLLTPSNKDSGKVDTANCKADGEATLESEEEAIAGMGNYDLMAYCPIY